MEAELIAVQTKIQDAALNQDSFLSHILALCEQEFGLDSFSKWFSRLEIVTYSDSEVIFSVPSKFVRDWLIREFVEKKRSGKTLKDLVLSLNHKIKKVAVICVAKTEPLVQGASNNPEKKIVNLSKYDNVFALGTELNHRFTFENFLTLKYNKLALAMARVVTGLDAQKSLFEDKIPLFIHGNVGIGKTHLAQAIAWQFKNLNKTKKVVYLSAERFMYHFVQSLRNNDVISFKEKMRSIDVLIVDDVQFIAGKESTQQEFMNCFNHMVEENKQVVLVCDRCPSDLENIDEKLKSRISGGMIVSFKTPDYQDRLAILKQKAQLLGQEIPEEILAFIADKVRTNVRDLEGALKKIVAEKVFLGEEVTDESVKLVIADYIKASKSSVPTIDKIQKIVAQFYGIKVNDLVSKNRSRAIARPRQIAMYFAKNLTRDSLPKIGQNFGSKNHATVIHSVKLVQKIIDSDKNFLHEIRQLEEKIIG